MSVLYTFYIAFYNLQVNFCYYLWYHHFAYETLCSYSPSSGEIKNTLFIIPYEIKYFDIYEEIRA